MKILNEILGWIGAIVLGIVIAIIINLFIFQPHLVDGESMEPTLHNNDAVFVSRIGKTFMQIPKRGDIVILDKRVDRMHTLADDLKDSLTYNIIAKLLFHRENRNYLIKRVIGIPGDTIELKDGEVYRNNELLTEEYINEPMAKGVRENTIIVPEGHVFVMGDNRNTSLDSRTIGTVPIQNVTGVYKFTIRTGKKD